MKLSPTRQPPVDAMHSLLASQQLSHERSEELRQRQKDKHDSEDDELTPAEHWLNVFFHGWR